MARRSITKRGKSPSNIYSLSLHDDATECLTVHGGSPMTCKSKILLFLMRKSAALQPIMPGHIKQHVSRPATSGCFPFTNFRIEPSAEPGNFSASRRDGQTTYRHVNWNKRDIREIHILGTNLSDINLDVAGEWRSKKLDCLR